MQPNAPTLINIIVGTIVATMMLPAAGEDQNPPSAVSQDFNFTLPNDFYLPANGTAVQLGSVTANLPSAGCNGSGSPPEGTCEVDIQYTVSAISDGLVVNNPSVQTWVQATTPNKVVNFAYAQLAIQPAPQTLTAHAYVPSTFNTGERVTLKLFANLVPPNGISIGAGTFKITKYIDSANNAPSMLDVSCDSMSANPQSTSYSNTEMMSPENPSNGCTFYVNR